MRPYNETMQSRACYTPDRYNQGDIMYHVNPRSVLYIQYQILQENIYNSRFIPKYVVKLIKGSIQVLSF